MNIWPFYQIRFPSLSALPPVIICDAIHWKDGRHTQKIKDRLDSFFAPNCVVSSRFFGPVEMFTVYFPAASLVYFGFQGSKDWADTKINFQFWPTATNIGPGRIHSGFNKLIRDYGPNLFEAIETDLRVYSPLQVVFTGHSQGAATACLMATICAKRHKASYPVVTFGAPAFGDREFNDYARSFIEVIRVQNSWDLVTHFHRVIPFYPYDHFQEETIFFDADRVKLGGADDFPPLDIYGVLRSFVPFCQNGGIQLHAPASYLKQYQRFYPAYFYDR